MLPPRLRFTLLTAILPILGGPGAFSADSPDAKAVEFFEKKVRPILVERCYECHSAEHNKSKGGLSLDSRETIRQGGDSGPSLVAGDPDQSLIIEAVRYANQDLQMPPKNRLPEAEVRVLEEWIKRGAADPRTSVGSAKAARVIDINEGRKHWAFRPLSSPPVPTAGTARHPIDAFIGQKLGAAGLQHSPPADKSSLIRRATFDLTGLPPTPGEVRDFLADTSAEAFSRVIDRLLRSPHYGEKWGRHWLDVARYADSNGLDENVAHGTAWRYRDYVVRAFNEDMPFDQFLIEQIAGDLLESRTLEERHQRATATAFLNLGAKVLAEQDKDKLVMDVVDEQIETTGRAFIGMTLGCVRCHDHKFDPILQDDYYALAAIFKSTASFSAEKQGAISYWHETPLAGLDEFAEVISAERTLAAKKAEVSKAEREAAEALRAEARSKAVNYLVAAVDLPIAPSPAQAKSVAAKAGLRHQIVLNCRVFLAANEDHPVFQVWQKAAGAGDKARIEKHYRELFATVAKTPPTKTKDAEPSPIDAARAALNDSKGFLALPPEPFVLYPSNVAEHIHGLMDERDQIEKSLPDLPTTMAVTEAETIVPALPIHIRGSHTSLGKPVERGFPVVMQASLAPKPAFPEKQSGRLELARWLANPDHTLTSRVLVNRIWTWHFGQGIVPTPDNFGLLGQSPTHPELLDWLARWITENGWSIKDLHRLIMTSATYQQASRTPAVTGSSAAQPDPENRLLHHFPVRRLEAEEIRDALLAAAGLLDLKMGGKTVPLRNRQFVFNHTSKDATTYESTRRALYLPVIRNNLYDLFQQFDYPDPATSTGLRNSTIVSPQALLLMNSSVSRDAASGFAQRLMRHSDDTAERVRHAYRLAYAREAAPQDLQRARNFLVTADAALASSVGGADQREQRAWSLLCQALMMANEFVYLR